MPKSREQEVLEGLPDGIRTTTELRKQFKMGDTNVRRILKRLVAKGYVVKESISIPGRKYNKQTVGWRKLEVRLKVDSTMGCHAKHVYAKASCWPRQTTSSNSPNGGLMTAETTPKRYKDDVEEVRDFLKHHLAAKTFDVALECHMTDNHAERLMRRVRCQR